MANNGVLKGVHGWTSDFHSEIKRVIALGASVAIMDSVLVVAAGTGQ